MTSNGSTSSHTKDLFPVLFVSHGSPSLIYEDGPAHRYLQSLSNQIPKPKAIVVFSAHWDSPHLKISGAHYPETIHDFHGFSRQLHELKYTAPGSPDLAEEIQKLLGHAGFSATIDSTRGLDHGAWVPLYLAYPQARIPVIQVSISSSRGPRFHYELGRALFELREKRVLLMGSGSVTHNLQELSKYSLNSSSPMWVTSFNSWLVQQIQNHKINDLFNYQELAPYAEANHPSEDHLSPLFASLGAAAGSPFRCLHHSFTYGILSMDIYGFGV